MANRSTIWTNVFSRLLSILFLMQALAALQLSSINNPVDIRSIPEGRHDGDTQINQLHFQYSKANDYEEFRQQSDGKGLSLKHKSRNGPSFGPLKLRPQHLLPFNVSPGKWDQGKGDSTGFNVLDLAVGKAEAQKKLEATHSQIAALKNENSNLNWTLAKSYENQFELEKYQQFAKDFIAEVAKLREELGDFSQDPECSQTPDSKNSSDQKDKLDIIDSLRAKFKAVMTKLKGMADSQKTLKQTSESYGLEKEKLAAENARLIQKINDSKAKIEASVSEVNQLKDQLNKSQSDLEISSKKVSDLEAEVKSLNGKYGSALEEKVHLAQFLITIQGQFKSVEAKARANSELMEKYAMLEKSHNSNLIELESLRKQVQEKQSLSSEVESLRQKNKDLVVLVENLRSESVKSKDTIWLLGNKLEGAEKDAIELESTQKRVSKLLESNQALSKEINKLIKETEASEETNKTLFAKNKSLEQANAELSEIVNDLKSKLKSNDSGRDLEKRVKELKDELANKKEEAKRLPALLESFEKLNAEFDILAKKEDGLRNENEALRSSVLKLEARLAIAESRQDLHRRSTKGFLVGSAQND